jgi:CheY-like chemotaxis protein
MPIMDGITATQNFRKLEREVSPAKKLPIVAVTSYAFPEECSKMLASGIDHIITKPISPKRLSNLLSQITCEVEYTETEQSRQQSDSEIIEELCKVASAVADRVSSFSADIEELCPMAFSQNLNLGDVYERSGNSIKRTGLILEGFNDSYRPLLELIESAVETPIPTDSLSRSVHAIKGLLLDVGADSAAALGEQIERRLLQDKQIADSTELRTFVDAIRNTALIVREVLSALPSLEIYSALPSTDLEAALH